MEEEVSATASAPPELHETKNARSICRSLFNRQRVYLSGWGHRTRERVRNISKRYFHRKVDNQNRCAFCADPRVKDWFKGGYYDKTELKMDKVPSMLSRRDTCILCLIISTVVARRDDFDPDQDVLLKYKMGALSVLVKGESGDAEEIGIFGAGSNSRRRFWLLQEPEKLGPHPGLTINPSISEKIDWPLVKMWIEDSPKTDDLDHYPTDFRLIDVENLCVVRARKPCEYACLSYVWGKDSSYQATLGNIHFLEQPNSLGTWDDVEQRSMIEGSDVPATIKDAIMACSALGKRYLWVDRLCILQDEDEANNPSKKEQINAMGDIYRCAFVTMVALEGLSATHGLSGVSLKRVPHYEVRIGDRALITSWWYVNHDFIRSMWNKRGWTYQEAILSPRLLFFTVYGLWYEHNDMDSMKSDVQLWATAGHDPHFQWKSSDKLSDGGLRYSSAVEMITEREFSYEWDILDGFSGVVNSFFGKDHRFAIPLKIFDHALLWKVRRNPSEKRQSQGNSVFPSWSWISVRGECYYGSLCRTMPVALWGFLDGNDVVQVPWPQTEDYILDDIVLGSILWRNGCMIEPFPDNLHFKGRLGKYENLFRENFPTKEEFLDQCHGIKPHSQERCRLLERFDKKQIAAGLRPGVVLGYSQAAVLTMRLDSYKEFKLYHQHREIGSICYDLLSDHSEALEMLQRGPVELEVFGLSASLGNIQRNDDRPIFNNDWREDEDIDFKSGSLEAGPPGFTKSVLFKISVGFGKWMNVMAIRTSNGISYRVGLGRVNFLEWMKLERTFKAIVLQ